MERVVPPIDHAMLDHTETTVESALLGQLLAGSTTDCHPQPRELHPQGAYSIGTPNEGAAVPVTATIPPVTSRHPEYEQHHGHGWGWGYGCERSMDSSWQHT